MKKLLGVLLAIAMSWPAGATVLKNVEVVGEIQTIASDVRTNNIDVAGARTYNTGTTARVLAGLSADLVEDVTANLLFQYANEWGRDEAAGRSVEAYERNIRLVNANVVLHNLFCAFDLTVGRQFYGDEDSAVMYFGPNHYNAEFNGYARSLDAAKLVYADDFKAFTLIGGRVNASAYHPSLYTTPGMNSFDMYGADLKLNLTNELKAQIYAYDFRDINGDNDAGFYGAKLAADIEAFRASVEYDRNFGGKRLVKEHSKAHGGQGHMLKADLALDMGKVTTRGTFLYANETFFAFGNYTPGLLVGHQLGGNIFDYSNEGVAMFNLGFDFKPFEKWTFALDGYTFQDHRFDHSATLEADLTAKYAHNEYVELFAGIGYAKYTKTNGYLTAYSKDRLGSDNVKGQLGMLIKF